MPNIRPKSERAPSGFAVTGKLRAGARRLGLNVRLKKENNHMGDAPEVSEPDPTKQVGRFIRNTLRIALTAPGFAAVAAIFGIAVLIAVISKFGMSWLVLVFGIVLAILLAVLYSCFSWVARIRNKHQSVLAGMLSYTVVFVVSASLLLIFSSVFSDTPLPIKTLIIAKLGSQNDAKVFLEDKTVEAVARSAQTKRQINRIIIGDTATPPRLKTNDMVSFFRTLQGNVGYHFIVDRNGFVYPMTDIENIVGHTSGNNQDSIGIGLEHNSGELFSKAQIAGLEKLLVSLVHRLKLDPNRILSQQEVKPERYNAEISQLLINVRNNVRQQIGV